MKKLQNQLAVFLLCFSMLFSSTSSVLAADTPSSDVPSSEPAASENLTAEEAPSPVSEYDAAYCDVDELPENVRSLVAQSLETAGESTANEQKIYLSSAQDAEIPAEEQLNQLRIEDPATGTGTMEIYSVPIKYLDADGKVRFIDTSLTPVPAVLSVDAEVDAETDYVYQNAANAFRTLFARTADDGVQADGDFRLSVADPCAQNAEAVAAEEENGAGKVRYPGAFGADTAVEYVNTEAGVKENIVLNSNIGRNRFDFCFESETCVPMLTEDGTRAYVVDKNNPDEIKYWFSSIYAYDSWLPEDPDQPQGDFRHFNEEGVYELAPLGENRWKLTVVVPAEYLNHPDLVYPVTIDPSYTTTAVPNGSSVVSDVFFDENGTRYNTDYLRFGNTAEGTIDSYIRFSSFKSHMPVNAEVVDATMTFKFRSGQTTGDNGKLTRVTSSWSQSSTSRPSYSTDITATASKNYVNSYIDSYTFNVYEFAYKWQTSYYQNMGVRLTYASGMLDYNSVVSSNGEAARAPQLQVKYQLLSATPGITSGAVYWIRNAVNHGSSTAPRNYLDITKNSTENGAAAQLYMYTGYYSERWQITYMGNGYYSIKAILPTTLPTPKSMMLDGRSNCVAGAQVVIYDQTSYYGELASSLQWRIVKLSNGSYQFIPKRNTGVALSVSGTSASNNPAVKLAVKNASSSSQQWALEKVEFGAAWELQKLEKGPPNCMGYALNKLTLGVDESNALLKNYIIENNVSSDNFNNLNYFQDTMENVLFEYVRKDLSRSIRPIGGPTATISQNEYRLCMRVGIADSKYDAHFWVQDITGAWGEKNGELDVQHDPVFTHPTYADWDKPEYYKESIFSPIEIRWLPNWYNSETRYYAATLS